MKGAASPARRVILLRVKALSGRHRRRRPRAAPQVEAGVFAPRVVDCLILQSHALHSVALKVPPGYWGTIRGVLLNGKPAAEGVVWFGLSRRSGDSWDPRRWREGKISAGAAEVTDLPPGEYRVLRILTAVKPSQ
jgi:hypothetical protein